MVTIISKKYERKENNEKDMITKITNTKSSVTRINPECTLIDIFHSSALKRHISSLVDSVILR